MVSPSLLIFLRRHSLACVLSSAIVRQIVSGSCRNALRLLGPHCWYRWCAAARARRCRGWSQSPCWRTRWSRAPWLDWSTVQVPTTGFILIFCVCYLKVWELKEVWVMQRIWKLSHARGCMVLRASYGLHLPVSQLLLLVKRTYRVNSLIQHLLQVAGQQILPSQKLVSVCLHR